MEIVSWNVNGIRATCEKGLTDWAKESFVPDEFARNFLETHGGTRDKEMF